MYLVGQGHQHIGPGTSMTQMIDWTRPQERELRTTGMTGMGCPGGCAGSCGGTCGGLGLFESGLDFSQWGAVEWAFVALGGYVLMSTVFTTGRAARAVARYPKERRKRKAAALRKRAKELGK